MKRSRGGFTLLELLAAAALLAILSVLLAAVVQAVTGISTRTTSRLEATRVGREIFEMIGRDLLQATGAPLVLRDTGPLQMVINPPDSPPGISVPASLKNPTAIFWQAGAARDRSGGDVVVVGYFVERTSDGASQLRRLFAEPTDVASFRLYAGGGEAWLSSDVLQSFRVPPEAQAEDAFDRGWVADGVLGLWVRCLDENGQPISHDGEGSEVGWSFDSQAGYRSGSGSGVQIRQGVNALPAYVEVGMVCIAARDIPRLLALPPIQQGSPGTFLEDIEAYAAAVSAQNPSLESVVPLIRRFPIRPRP